MHFPDVALQKHLLILDSYILMHGPLLALNPAVIVCISFIIPFTITVTLTSAQYTPVTDVSVATLATFCELDAATRFTDSLVCCKHPMAAVTFVASHLLLCPIPPPNPRHPRFADDVVFYFSITFVATVIITVISRFSSFLQTTVYTDFISPLVMTITVSIIPTTSPCKKKTGAFSPLLTPTSTNLVLLICTSTTLVTFKRHHPRTAILPTPISVPPMPNTFILYLTAVDGVVSRGIFAVAGVNEPRAPRPNQRPHA
ncbi:hypothetical protein ACOMHN_012058 [Nucella lapillus]